MLLEDRGVLIGALNVLVNVSHESYFIESFMKALSGDKLEFSNIRLISAGPSWESGILEYI